MVWIAVIAGVLAIGWFVGGRNGGSSGSSDTPRIVEAEPPVGDGMTLNADQIRYCLSERVRIDSWNRAASQPSPAGVITFNGAVDHYNARCSRFRYKRGTLESVRSDVESRKAALQSQGAAKAFANP